MQCPNCGRAVKQSQQFCPGCGTRLPVWTADQALPASSPVAGAAAGAPPADTLITSPSLNLGSAVQATAQIPIVGTVCPGCGTALAPSAAFCRNCGRPVQPPAPVAADTSTRCAFCSAEMKPSAKFCGSCGATVGYEAGAPTAYQTQAEADPRRALDLWPPSQPWKFQYRTTEVAAQAVANLGQAGIAPQSQLGGMLSRMIRASLLDTEIYREVAADEGLQLEAWKITGLVIALSLGYLLFSFLGGFMPGLGFVLFLVVAQLAAWFARIWGIKFTLSTWLKQEADFRQLFRALSYAQSPALFGFVPAVGPITMIWAFVTNVAAVRDVTGRTTGQAVILTLAGFVVAAIATSIVTAASASLLLRHFF